MLPLAQSSSYVPIGRPEIVQSKPQAPPTPVGTSYASKRNELADIRAGTVNVPKSAPTPKFGPSSNEDFAPPAPPPAPVQATVRLASLLVVGCQ